MDQESFRQLLESRRGTQSNANGTPTAPRGSLVGKPKTKAKTVSASEPAFQPRKVKKPGKYRDRATERREGGPNDFAEAEALLEDFEKRNAEAADLEDKRRYLGGDSEHSILVKGLDFALLEQNKARVAAEAAAVDDELLEKAFEEVAVVPKKRTREEIMRDLKAKRKKGDVDINVNAEGEDEGARAEKEKEQKEKDLEEAKKKGKFRPIGFKPIGGAAEEGKKKKKKEKDEGERKKKKRKIESAAPAPTEDKTTATRNAQPSTSKQEAPQLPAPAISPPEPEPMDDDFDIFAGAGEYEGVDLGDDEDEEEGEVAAEQSRPEGSPTAEEPSEPPAGTKWFATDDERPALPSGPPPILEKLKAKARTPQPEEGEEEEQPARLAPLAGSAIPSIKEFLRMEEEAEKEKKKKARRDKKKGKKSKDDGDSE
ncbi:hypothetical protein OE88DRAFT_540679 [Heliocybe sulcata]|uniref:RED-like N-terminal domain-containing protein n=1 Tax=Heliocybe sulcata TaxID=5364 RepID=A0A5C3MUC6_9AGAM|nr:hypothetical protein OE88DRAFT_540679 [Heliocybe sulcata]